MIETKKNRILWVSLVAMILLSTLFAENGLSYAVYLIVTLTAIKFMGVTFQFVETKNAAAIWKVVSLGFVAIYVIGVLVLY